MKWIVGLLCVVLMASGIVAFAQTPETKTFKLTIVGGTYRDAKNKEQTGTGEFAAGAKVWITAEDAAPGKTFYQWDRNIKEMDVNSLGQSRALITMPATDLTLTASYKEFKAIRVACLGETPTDMTNYPKDLGRYLNGMKADQYDVKNFGAPDTLIGAGTDKPYVKSAKYEAALKFEPNVVVMMFGGQDTQKGKNFATHDTFVAEYKKLIASFTDLPSKPKVYICLPPPMMGSGQWGLNNENLVSTVIPNIKKVAEDLKLPLIDTNTPFVGHPELFHDNVHCVGESNILFAGAVFHAMTGKEPPENPKKTSARAVVTTAPATEPAKNP